MGEFNSLKRMVQSMRNSQKICCLWQHFWDAVKGMHADKDNMAEYINCVKRLGTSERQTNLFHNITLSWRVFSKRQEFWFLDDVQSLLQRCRRTKEENWDQMYFEIVAGLNQELEPMRAHLVSSWCRWRFNSRGLCGTASFSIFRGSWPGKANYWWIPYC